MGAGWQTGPARPVRGRFCSGRAGRSNYCGASRLTVRRRRIVLIIGITRSRRAVLSAISADEAAVIGLTPPLMAVRRGLAHPAGRGPVKLAAGS